MNVFYCEKFISTFLYRGKKSTTTAYVYEMFQSRILTTLVCITAQVTQETTIVCMTAHMLPNEQQQYATMHDCTYATQGTTEVQSALTHTTQQPTRGPGGDTSNGSNIAQEQFYSCT